MGDGVRVNSLVISLVPHRVPSLLRLPGVSANQRIYFSHETLGPFRKKRNVGGYQPSCTGGIYGLHASPLKSP